MIKRAFAFLSPLPLCGVLLCTTLQAQELSADGRRWVEVEVLVFRSLAVGAGEVANPGRLALNWPVGMRALDSLDSSYAYPFPADLPPTVAFAAPQGSPFSTAPAPGAFEAEEPGPLLDFTVPYAPALPDGFKVLDYAHDPYIALDQRDWQLSGVARNLQGSSEYDVLWHQGWRQPLLPRAQVAAIAVQGGVEADTHTALEGNLRLSVGSGVQANVDANLWFSEFGQPAAGEETEWTLPPLPQVLEQLVAVPSAPPALNAPPRRDGPIPLDANSVQAVAPPPAIARIWQLRESRDVNPSQLYYLDHPRLGVLLEVRPYVLPELFVPESTDDF
ncbi:MAG TPA: CsiV family protein [Hyphomicrobiales bacterium]|nr:CsiV family protein [Hyphomicrobiales bacterium]